MLIAGGGKKPVKKQVSLSVKQKNELLLLLQKQVGELQQQVSVLELMLAKRVIELQKEVGGLQKKIGTLESILPKYVHAVDHISNDTPECVTQHLLPVVADKSVVNQQIRLLVDELMRTPMHAQLRPGANKEAFMAYINVVDACDIKWVNNVCKNKSALQSCLHDYGSQLTREEFLRVVEWLQKCFETYSKTLSSDMPIDKFLMFLAKREVWRFFYTAHGTAADLKSLLQQTANNDNAVVWSLIVAKRLGSLNGPGVPDGLLRNLIALYTSKLDALIVLAGDTIKPLYEHSKNETLQMLQSLKKI